MDATNDEADLGVASPFQPPLEPVQFGFVNPVRIEPVDHIVVTADGDKLPCASSDRFRDRGGADLCDLAVDDARELVDDCQASDSASARARLTRNCSPLERHRNGRTQLGGDEKPTEESNCVISAVFIPFGNDSTSDLSDAHSN